MPDIQITFQDLRNKTRTLRGHNENLTRYLQQIQSKINALESEWTSDTSDTIRSKITGMQRTFDSYHGVIESYAAFLDRTVQAYEEAEQNLNSNAASQFI